MSIDDLDLAAPKVEPICEELGLSEQVTERAKQFAENADLKHPINKSPTAVAAASVYLASVLHNEKRTQREIEAVADTSAVSIRNAYPRIAEHEDIPLARNLPENGRDDGQRSPNRLFAKLREVLE